LALPARAIADAAPEYVSDWEIRALVTFAVQRGLCTPEELSDALVRAARRGSARLRRPLEDVRDGAGSVSEALAADRLRAVDVPAFALNVPILDAQGRLVAVADFLWRELRAVLVIDREANDGPPQPAHVAGLPS
jgi:hypothetical protein